MCARLGPDTPCLSNLLGEKFLLCTQVSDESVRTITMKQISHEAEWETRSGGAVSHILSCEDLILLSYARLQSSSLSAVTGRLLHVSLLWRWMDFQLKTQVLKVISLTESEGEWGRTPTLAWY